MDKQRENGVGKKIVLDFLEYLSFKIRNDSLTMEEADSLARVFTETLKLTGTIDDLARYYGQNRDNIKVVINRKLLSKPHRRVFYSFNAFRQVIPQRWLNKKEGD